MLAGLTARSVTFDIILYWSCSHSGSDFRIGTSLDIVACQDIPHIITVSILCWLKTPQCARGLRAKKQYACSVVLHKRIEIRLADNSINLIRTERLCIDSHHKGSNECLYQKEKFSFHVNNQLSFCLSFQLQNYD